MTPNMVKQKIDFQSKHKVCSTGDKVNLFKLITYISYYNISFFIINRLLFFNDIDMCREKNKRFIIKSNNIIQIVSNEFK